jgi:hypothetical protein
VTLTLDGARLAERPGHGDLALMVPLHPAIPRVDTAGTAQPTPPPQPTGQAAAASTTA